LTRKLAQNFLLIILFLLPLFSVAQTTTVTLTTVGSGSWQVPYGVTSITVECYGGGGGGGGRGTLTDAAPGGGGGGYGKSIISVSCGQVYYYSVGGGGPKNGGNGGDSWFGSNQNGSSPSAQGAGGGGGGGSCTTFSICGTVGSGGSANVGNSVTRNGGNGGKAGSDGGGGGGGAGGSSTIGSNGNNGGGGGSGNASGGAGGGGYASNGGNGGCPGSQSGCSSTGATPSNYGAGGGGASDGNLSSNYDGGSGAQGIIIITYTTPSTPSNITPITVTGSTTLCAGQTTTLTPNLPTGGDISMVGTDRVHRFTSSATSCDGFSTPYSITGARILIVGGGGGGGQNGGGGGGAGEFIYRTGQSLNAGVYSVLVGAGGAVGDNDPDPLPGPPGVSPGGIGGFSYFNGIFANGGGGGANRDYGGAATSGGSGGGGGGGASPQINAGGVVLLGAGTGNNGGGGRNKGCKSAGGGGGGSGGAGGAGADNKGGDGGAGSSNDITGVSLYYTGGGGGGTTNFNGGGCGNGNSWTNGVGGSGVGGTGEGSVGSSGVSAPGPVLNSGSGGGAEQVGAAGVVIIRYSIGTPTWSSNNPTVATVVTNGDGTATVTAVAGAGGTADITYSLNTTVYKQTITVRPEVSNPNATVAIEHCANPTNPFAVLSATAPVTGSGTWAVSTGPGTLASTTANPTALNGISTITGTDVTWTVAYPTGVACSKTQTLSNIKAPFAMDSNTITLQNTGAATSTPRPNYYTCATCSVRDGNTYSFYDNAGKIVATIQDLNAPSSELGLTEVCVGYDYNAGVAAVTKADVDAKKVLTDLGDWQPYLPRSWTVKPTLATNSIVTLYFTNDELNALVQSAAGSRYAFAGYQLAVTKYPNGSGNGSFIAPKSAGGENVPCIFGSYNGGHKVAFNINTFSTFYVHPQFYPFAPLPVELVSFIGWNENNINKLQWVTASELNSDKFEIEKSTVSGVWNTIGDVRAAGNSNIKLTYNFTDNNPVVGDNYYRLKMIDIDGTFKYSNTINIPISEAITNGFAGVYPNPTGGELNVDIQSVGLYDTYVSVYDVLGKTIFEKPVTIVRGMNKLQFNFNQLAKGTYILRFADAQGKLHTAKFVKD
jgi:hypothetical protein